jgi:hypothetical protein
MKLAFIFLFAFTLFNTGLIWTIQLVHYPGFLQVGKENYAYYQQLHMQRISPLVGVSMAAELLSSLLILLMIAQLPYKTIYVISLLILAAIWLHTIFLAVPFHGRLANEYDESAIRELINTNWWRTIGWTVRSILIGFLLYRNG